MAENDFGMGYAMGMDAGGGNQFLVSSAGGNFVDCTMNFTRVPAEGEAVKLSVGGLIGGHSGGAADTERASALKLMARALYRLRKEFPIQLAEISGGTKSNAIPREASCVAMLQGATLEDAKKIIAALEKELKAELAAPDPDVFVTVEATSAETMLDKATSDKLMHALHLMPNGRQVMSKVIAGLVAVSFACSFAAGHIPGVRELSSGTRTMLLTVALSALAAWKFPRHEEEEEADA